MTVTIEGATQPEKVSALQGQFASGAVDAAAYAGFAGEAQVTGDNLAALSAMAEELVACERNLADAMAEVVKAKNALADVQEKRLPDLMESASMDKFTFTDRTTGIKRVIELINKWAVSMPPKSGKTADPQWATKHEAIFNWLAEIGNGAVLKKVVEANLGLASDEVAKHVAEIIKAAEPDLEVTIEKYVEPATLTALISRMKDAGESVHEFLQVKPRREAKVKAGKATQH